MQCMHQPSPANRRHKKLGRRKAWGTLGYSPAAAHTLVIPTDRLERQCREGMHRKRTPTGRSRQDTSLSRASACDPWPLVVGAMLGLRFGIGGKAKRNPPYALFRSVAVAPRI